MILSPRQIEELKEATKPLMKFLNDNFHPLVTVIVGPTRAEILEGKAAIENTEFAKD